MEEVHGSGGLLLLSLSSSFLPPISSLTSEFGAEHAHEGVGALRQHRRRQAQGQQQRSASLDHFWSVGFAAKVWQDQGRAICVQQPVFLDGAGGAPRQVIATRAGCPPASPRPTRGVTWSENGWGKPRGKEKERRDRVPQDQLDTGAACKAGPSDRRGRRPRSREVRSKAGAFERSVEETRSRGRALACCPLHPRGPQAAQALHPAAAPGGCYTAAICMLRALQ